MAQKAKIHRCEHDPLFQSSARDPSPLNSGADTRYVSSPWVRAWPYLFSRELGANFTRNLLNHLAIKVVAPLYVL